MPFPSDIVRCAFRGRYMSGGTPTEIEQFVFKIDTRLHLENIGTTFVWADEIQDWATKMGTKFTQAWSLISALFPTTVRVDEVRAYHLDTSGHTLDMAQASINVAGTASSFSLPTEVALAVSLYAYDPGSFNPDGGKARGRFYLPALATSTIDAGGFLNTSARNVLMQWAEEWLEDVQGTGVGPSQSTTHMDLVLASSTDGEARQVQAIRIGRVFDVQRRRRRSLAESYSDVHLDNH